MKENSITLTLDEIGDKIICEIIIDDNLNVLESIMPLTEFTEGVINHITEFIEDGMTEEHLKKLSFKEYYKIVKEDE